MNYNDQILENKTFNFFKQLMYNLALSICIMLAGVLVAIYVFGFKLYNVKTGSERPYLMEGDIAIVRAQDKYVVGDIVKFKQGVDVVHRLVAIINDNGVDYYICHGDNNASNLDGSQNKDSDWKDDAAYIQELLDKGKTRAEISQLNVQTKQLKEIEGKVVSSVKKYGTYVNIIKEHYMLFISLVAGIWCISSVVQNEIEMKKARRLA